MSDFIGAKSSLTVPESTMPFRGGSERPSSESAMVGSKGNNKAAHKKSWGTYTKPFKPHRVVWAKNLFGSIPVLKELVPDAPMFNRHKQNDRIDSEGGWTLSCVIPPILLLEHALSLRPLTLGVTRFPNDTTTRQISRERASNSHEYTISSPLVLTVI